MSGVNLLRIYLLAGLVLHKAVWEIMKRKPRFTPEPRRRTLRLALVKGAKVAILLALVAQVFLPDIAPIAREPRPLRVAGLVLFTGGLAMALAGRIQLGDNWLDIESAGVKSGQVLVSGGLYGYVRHPIYGGDLLLISGLELALNSWLILLVPVLAAVVVRRVLAEEKILERSLPGYAKYCKGTKRFVPFLI